MCTLESSAIDVAGWRVGGWLQQIIMVASSKRYSRSITPVLCCKALIFTESTPAVSSHSVHG